MKIAVSTITWGRLDVLDRCLESIGSNKEVAGGMPVFIHPDAVPDAELSETRRMCSKHIPNGWVMDRPAERLRNYRNAFRAISYAFDHPDGYDYLIRLDSDLVVSRNYINVLSQMGKWSGGFSMSSIVCAVPPDTKRACASTVIKGFHTGTNGIISRSAWESIQPVIEEFEHLFMRDGSLSSCPRQWMRQSIMDADTSKILPGDLQVYMNASFGTAADGILKFAMDLKGITYATTFVNRAIHPSAEGECTSGNPNAWIMTSQTLDEIESDAGEIKFEWSAESKQ